MKNLPFLEKKYKNYFFHKKSPLLNDHYVYIQRERKREREREKERERESGESENESERVYEEYKS